MLHNTAPGLQSLPSMMSPILPHPVRQQRSPTLSDPPRNLRLPYEMPKNTPYTITSAWIKGLPSNHAALKLLVQHDPLWKNTYRKALLHFWGRPHVERPNPSLRLDVIQEDTPYHLGRILHALPLPHRDTTLEIREGSHGVWWSTNNTPNFTPWNQPLTIPDPLLGTLELHLTSNPTDHPYEYFQAAYELTSQEFHEPATSRVISTLIQSLKEGSLRQILDQAAQAFEDGTNDENINEAAQYAVGTRMLLDTVQLPEDLQDDLNLDLFGLDETLPESAALYLTTESALELDRILNEIQPGYLPNTETWYGARLRLAQLLPYSEIEHAARMLKIKKS